MPAPPGYASFYDQQKSSFKNPLDTMFLPSTSAPSTLQGKNVADNLGTAPDLTSLTNLVNTLNRNAQKQSNEARVPGSVGIESQLSKNTASLAKGQLPQDVINQIQQQSAERGVSTGNDSFLRSLGLNSLQAGQMAQQNLSQATARNPGAPIFDPTTQFLTPYQRGNLDNQGSLLSLDWFNALNRGGGGLAPRGTAYGLGHQVTDADVGGVGTGAASNAWWNSLFPAQTAPGVPSAGGGGYTPGLLPNDPGLPDLGVPPSYYDYPNPAQTNLPADTYQNSDPFAGYA